MMELDHFHGGEFFYTFPCNATRHSAASLKERIM